jgi:hypothetical protein
MIINRTSATETTRKTGYHRVDSFNPEATAAPMATA